MPNGTLDSAPNSQTPVQTVKRGFAITLTGVFSIAFIVVTIVVLTTVASFFRESVQVTQSSQTRFRLKTTTPYQNKIFDMMGGLNNTTALGKELESFYDLTGVQPAIVLMDNPGIINDEYAQKKEADRLFEYLQLPENTFMLACFADLETDHSGDWITKVGSIASGIMDEEALKIFDDYLSLYESSAASEEEIIADTFNATAKRIMSRTANELDPAFWIWIGSGIVAAAVFAVLSVKLERKTRKPQC